MFVSNVSVVHDTDPTLNQHWANVSAGGPPDLVTSHTGGL